VANTRDGGEDSGPPKVHVQFAIAAMVAALVGAAVTFLVVIALLFGENEADLVDDGRADPLAWALVFLMGGMSAFFAILGFLSLHKPPAKKAEESGDDKTMDTVARWVRAANLLAEGVEQIGAHSYVLDVSIARRAHDLQTDARSKLQEAKEKAESPDITLRENLKEPQAQLAGMLEALKAELSANGLAEAITLAKQIAAALDDEQREKWQPVVALLEAALVAHDAGRALANAGVDLLEAARQAKASE